MHRFHPVCIPSAQDSRKTLTSPTYIILHQQQLSLITEQVSNYTVLQFTLLLIFVCFCVIYQITVGLLQDQGQKVLMAKECLAPGYLRLTQADIAFMASGDVMVAASDGTVGSAVQCFNVSVKMENNSCHIFSAPGASFFLKSLTDYNNRDNQNVGLFNKL